MFSIDCPVLATEVVIWSDQVTALTQSPHGRTAEFHCACGAAAVCVAGEGPTHGRLIYHASLVSLACA